MKARTLAVARGAHKRAADEPKVWFTSVKSLAACLTRGRALRTELKGRLGQK
jgi:predicted transcriptional regulator